MTHGQASELSEKRNIKEENAIHEKMGLSDITSGNGYNQMSVPADLTLFKSGISF